MTYDEATDGLGDRMRALASQLGSDDFRTRVAASQQLVAIGEPAYQFLQDFSPGNTESRYRVNEIIRGLEQLRKTVERQGFDHDIALLSDRSGDDPRAVRRLRSILPDGIPPTSATEWWKEHRQQFRWDATDQRYVRNSKAER